MELNQPKSHFISIADTNGKESILVPDILLNASSVRIDELTIENGLVKYNEVSLEFNADVGGIKLNDDSLILNSLSAGINIGAQKQLHIYDFELNYDGQKCFASGDINVGNSSLKFYDQFELIKGHDIMESEHLGKMHAQLNTTDLTMFNQVFSEINEHLSVYASFKGNWYNFNVNTFEAKSSQGSKMYLNAKSEGKALSLDDAYFKLQLDSVVLLQKDLMKYHPRK